MRVLTTPSCAGAAASPHRSMAARPHCAHISRSRLSPPIFPCGLHAVGGAGSRDLHNRTRLINPGP